MRMFLDHELAILRSVLIYVPQRSDARDIVQETAVALWNHFDKYDPARPFLNWAFGFARIEVRRFLRRAHRRSLLSEAAVDTLMEADAGPSEQDALRERHLRDCLGRLPREQRLIIDGYYMEELTVDELARHHDRSIDAIYKLLQRIRRALLGCMERRMSEAYQ